MRSLVFACLFLLAASPVFAANPKATVFPPANCSPGEQRVITWQDGTTTTYCATGQDVMKLAMPDCGADQHVVYDGSRFFCKTVASPPVCGANEFLTFDGNGYTCNTPNAGQCTDGQTRTTQYLIDCSSSYEQSMTCDRGRMTFTCINGVWTVDFLNLGAFVP